MGRLFSLFTGCPNKSWPGGLGGRAPQAKAKKARASTGYSPQRALNSERTIRGTDRTGKILLVAS